MLAAVILSENPQNPKIKQKVLVGPRAAQCRACHDFKVYRCFTMFMDVASPQLDNTRMHKMQSKAHNNKSEKKRKQRPSDSLERATPAKKQRHWHKSTLPTTKHKIKQKIACTETSPFYQQTSSLFLPLAPIAQRHPVQGLCAEHLSPLLLTYYPPLHGVVIAYTNPRCSSTSDVTSATDGRQHIYARSISEYAASFVWLTADFLVFRPQKGNVVDGYINLQNESNIGLLCWNFFSASIDRNMLPRDWRWFPGDLKVAKRKRKLKAGTPDSDTGVDGAEEVQRVQIEKPEDTEGFFQDETGKRIGGFVHFKVQCVDTSGSMHRENGYLSIHGNLLSDEEWQERGGSPNMRNNRVRQRDMDGKMSPAMATALINGNSPVMDVD